MIKRTRSKKKEGAGEEGQRDREQDMEEEEEQWGYDHHWSLGQWNWSLPIFKASFGGADGWRGCAMRKDAVESACG